MRRIESLAKNPVAIALVTALALTGCASKKNNLPNNAADLARWRQQIGALPRFARHAVRGVIERGNVLNELGKIRCPVLVLVGEEDQTTPATCAEKIAERIADARLISLPKVGHMSSLEAPRQINAVIDSFLSTVQHDARDAIAELTEI